jgi:hypothetical protein
MKRPILLQRWHYKYKFRSRRFVLGFEPRGFAVIVSFLVQPQQQNIYYRLAVAKAWDYGDTFCCRSPRFDSLQVLSHVSQKKFQEKMIL